MTIKSMNISDAIVSGLTFKNVTPDDVKSTMKQFNKLPGAIVKN